jgi:hypothetical protein
VPYVLVVGDDDVEHGTVGVNRAWSDEPERGVQLDDFIARSAKKSPNTVTADESRTALGRLARVVRLDPNTGRTDDGCVICKLVAATDDAAALVLRAHAGDHRVMNLYPYGSGT